MSDRHAMRLTITLTTEDGVPGHPARFGKVFPHIQDLLEQGERGGSFEHTVTYGLGGSDMLTDMLRVDWYVMPVGAGAAG